MKPLILVGGGGHCKSVIEVAESAGYQIKGILDLPQNVGKSVLGYPVIGTDEDISVYIHQTLFAVTVGHIKDVSLRKKIYENIIGLGGELPVIVASTARVSKYALIEQGCVIMHQAVVNADAKIGRGCIINTSSNIEHDVSIGNYCHVSTGAMVNGNCEIGSGTFLGSQSVTVNGIRITEGCIIAAGAVVRKNIDIRGIYSGNPALLKLKL